ncbi:MAG: hypothetical protein LBJ58_02775 [Tannerellaceae bacterium]|jgi:hypothetical protein|nr:hypothetical protein [Tannerellaceae bacterium]
MMNYFKSYLTAGLFLLPFIAHSQISNVQVAAEGEQIVITYDYAAQSESIDNITVTYTTGDETESKEAVQVTGDIRDLTPGTGKRIVWSPLSEMTTFSAENLVINLTGERDKDKQEQCENSLKLADQFFAAGDYESAGIYYREMIDCTTCNCNPGDILHATDQLRLVEINLKIKNEKDKVNIAYLFDMATAEDGGSMHGISAFLLRNEGVGAYASFRSNKNFYSNARRLSYYDSTDDDTDTPLDLDGNGLIDENDVDPRFKSKYALTPLGNTRISSWLFSTGITHKLLHSEYGAGFIYGGIGIGANGIDAEYSVSETGYVENKWLTNGTKNLFLSPEVGVIANVYDYFSVMAGIKYPISLTSNEAIKTKGLSAMLGVGVKLKSIAPQDGYSRAGTYLAYVLDLPGKAGPDRLKSTNIIGLSVGTLSYHKMGVYLSARVNPLLLGGYESGIATTQNYTYTGVSDYANGFVTAGFTWMYFYAGIGLSYQREYKQYLDGGVEKWDVSWKSSSDGTEYEPEAGFCTEFGLNLRLFDHLLLRGGVTFPGFKLNSKNNEFTMTSTRVLASLGIGYVFGPK